MWHVRQVYTTMSTATTTCIVLTSAKAMVIKLTVSQTSENFSRMRAGGVYFYYWHMFLINIINYASAGVQYLQRNERENGRIVNA